MSREMRKLIDNFKTFNNRKLNENKNSVWVTCYHET
jgi:hypothetical protein